MKIIKNFAATLILALLAINSAYAVTPAGTAVAAKASGFIAGGSNISLTWTAPAAGTYKIWLQVPKGSKATNALYRLYPNGSSANNTFCSATDATYPCFEIPVNQALNQNKWLQLTTPANTQFNFVKNGFVGVNPANLPTSELLGVAAVRFEKIIIPLAIGQTYQGGIIFYLDATGQHGLIAAPTDQSTSALWYNGTYTLTGSTATAVGTGKANTAAIVAKQGAGLYAAKLCDDLVLGGYSDWYLPAKDELSLMYATIGQGAAAPLTNLGNFAAFYYWSSSEYSSNFGWNQSFFGNDQYYFSKNSPLNVRAVRSF